MVQSATSGETYVFRCSGCLTHTFLLLRNIVDVSSKAGTCSADQFADFVVSLWLVRSQLSNPIFSDLGTYEDMLRPLDFPDIASKKAKVRRSTSQGKLIN